MEVACFCRQSIFDVYLGLTAAGYELANPSRAGAMIEAVGAAVWAETTMAYFAQARIADGRINPYWPRGSILAGVSCLTEEHRLGTDLDSLQAYLATLHNVAPNERGPELARWLLAFPEQKRLLRASGSYSVLFLEYVQIIQREAAQNEAGYRWQVERAGEALARLLPSRPFSVRTVLNPLQADELVDVLRAGDAVWVITSHLRPDAGVHELAHAHLEAWLLEWAPLISFHRELLDAVYEPMRRAGYAWDRSAASWLNVLTETMARCLTVWVLSDGDPAKGEAQVDALGRQGFLYARPVFEALVSARPPLTERWLRDCFHACGVAATHFS
jgi:hypothetical protein